MEESRLKICNKCNKPMKPLVSLANPKSSEWYCEHCQYSILMNEIERPLWLRIHRDKIIE